ncbi:hypothetical protein AB0D57_42830 [Streptomyces sp. NPDC048275]|uniref:hypothetical protein n=1 Tax=Streptomyces sp. NPDC048275 TaxID=3155629 RepID=UPI0034042C25
MPESSVPVISPTQLAADAAHTPLLNATARPVAPVLAVDLDEPAAPAVLDAAVRRPGHATGCSSESQVSLGQ